MKKCLKKGIVTLGLITSLSVLGSLSAYAGEWKQDEVGWWYSNDDGSYTTNNWQEIDNHWFYFNKQGYMLVETWTPDNYYVGFNGAWVEDVDKYTRLREKDIESDRNFREKWDDDDGSPLGTFWVDVPNVGTINSSDPRAAGALDFRDPYEGLSPEAKKKAMSVRFY